MPYDIHEVPDAALPEFLEPLFTALGLCGSAEATHIYADLGHDVRFAAYDGEQVAGTAALFDFNMTVPGGRFAPTAGVTLVAVRATHRRQGILRQLMLRCLAHARAARKPLSALFATEGAIYGRFGYGLATWWLNLQVDHPSDVLSGQPEVPGTFRLLTATEAENQFPAIWEQLRPRCPGMLSRSPAWWRQRRVSEPSFRRAGRAELQNVLFEAQGQPLGYAIYRHGSGFEHGLSVASLEVSEVMALTSAAQYAVWRYLFSMDLARRLIIHNLSPDHPLRFMVADPARLRPTLERALYVRIVDVEQALGLREFGSAPPVTLGIRDELCPWNEGAYRVTERGPERTSQPAELSLDVRELGSVYLGGVSFAELLASGRISEISPGSAARADALFVRGRAPWCPDMF